MYIGVDEAGRGCVIGPLVISGVFTHSLENLKGLGVKDSKLLSPISRTRLYHKLIIDYDYSVESITATTLNRLMKKHSLNEIEAMYVAKIVDSLLVSIHDGKVRENKEKSKDKSMAKDKSKGSPESEDKESRDKVTVYIDCPDTITSMFEKRLFKYLTKDTSGVDFVIEHKADVNYPPASAASIIAKVTRDMEIERIKKEVGYEFGSGYSSDPQTIGYLEKHLMDKNIKPYIRTKWATVDRLLQPKIMEF